MKKFLFVLIASTSLLMVSCRWIHETFTSVESCTEWYCDEFYDAAVDKDVEDACERADQFSKWLSKLSESDLNRAELAFKKWVKNNPNKASVTKRFMKEHKIKVGPNK